MYSLLVFLPNPSFKFTNWLRIPKFVQWSKVTDRVISFSKWDEFIYKKKGGDGGSCCLLKSTQ